MNKPEEDPDVAALRQVSAHMIGQHKVEHSHAVLGATPDGRPIVAPEHQEDIDRSGIVIPTQEEKK
jgi:hypothetical protein